MNMQLATKAVSNVVAKAERINRETTLYCTECCTSFNLSNGEWVAEGFKGRKVAEVIQDRMIVCTCGVTLGVYVSDIIIPGQVVPIH